MPKTQARARLTKQELIYDALRERILSGAYGPGYRVVIDTLAGEFSVSALPVREAILQGAAMRIRPLTMTALTAIFGLLPAALSTKIGSQTQRPLAIVVVGAMLTTLFLTRFLLPVIYSFYGHREPPAEAGGLAH